MWFIAFLMLSVPGLVSLRLHGINKADKENWQEVLFVFLLYSMAIIFFVNLIMFITFHDRTVSFSPFDRTTNSSIFYSSFIIKYTLFAMIFALLLPNLYKRRQRVRNFLKKFLRSQVLEDE
ncbi:MAG: hypothetical protein LBL96_12350 [Clostridiales bacterium]|jgi:hypothetical protein|nr:hypothetical protein [Clostridiales bacterium]